MKGAPKRRVFNDPGHAHELTFSTFRRTRLLEDVAHFRAFLKNLDRARRELAFEVWAYVLMPDHVHLLVWPRSGVYSMADLRQSLKQPVAKAALARMVALGGPRLSRLNDGRGRHFWQLGGGYDRNIHSAQACKGSIDYIHDNPVVAGLCRLPSEYEWSSAGWYEGHGGGFEVDRAKY